ncbi:sporulation protein [Streptomyces sp. MUSC 125]|uniref:sporulation protein n=1 Tax=Streptomyces sp. MUSC 125 TaxID=1428624 RepID=UPI00057DF213|nr:sporulation protein [Streptomyces sp. MUSC 125]KIE28790.1 sporulation protein [Streptomyces sp. MUSC 125]
MVFKRLLGAMGVGGPGVDTVLDGGPVLPGGALTGRVLLRGGESAVGIEHIGLELIARVEAEHEDAESEGTVVFDRFTICGYFRLGEHEDRELPFSVPVPWETPITELHGQPLGIVLGVRTEVRVAGARDKGDLDPLAVRPLPVQEAVLEALGQVGFGFHSADLEYGRIGGTGQQLPFYQEIELFPAPQYAHAVQEVELTFLASPTGAEVVLEADKRERPHSSGHDALARFELRHDDATSLDWNREVESWMAWLTEHHHAHSGHPEHHHGDVPHPDHHPGHDDHRCGPGLGTALAVGAAGLAVGVVGGLVAAEVVDEIGDFFEDDQGDEDGDDGDGDDG